jgi:inorganic pyrophosphatase
MRYHDFGLGEKCPEIFNVVVEIPKDSRNKYEIEGGFLILDRVLHSSLSYPTNYGFLPQTLAKDGDALDALVWSRYALVPQCIVKVRPLGVLKMRDEEGEDNKILAIPIKEHFFDDLKDIEDVQEGFLKEISQFFLRYKELEEGKVSEIDGWFGKKEAKQFIKKAYERNLKT